MKVSHVFVCCFALSGGLALTPLFGDSSGRARANLLTVSAETTSLAERVLAATVHFVQVVKRSENGEIERGSGSGFVVDAVKGFVVTNHHVVGEAGSVLRVQLNDGRVIDGTVIGSDSRTDVAVVRIPEGVVNYQLEWGDSDLMMNGAWVMAVGNPLGLVGTSSLGIVSGLHRELKLQEGFLSDFIQSDAFIDRGSSGGPLVNMEGRVIGINTAIEGSAWQGKGWAVPSHLARPVAEEIWKTGSMSRGWLGLTPQDLESSYASQVGLSSTHGVRIKSVTESSPSYQAGIRRGDVLLSMDGVILFSTNQLRARAGVLSPGSQTSFNVWRDGRTWTFRVAVVSKF